MNAPTPDPDRLQWNYEAARRIIHGLLVAIDGGLSSDLRHEADNARAFMRSTSAKRSGNPPPIDHT